MKNIPILFTVLTVLIVLSSCRREPLYPEAISNSYYLKTYYPEEIVINNSFTSEACSASLIVGKGIPTEPVIGTTEFDFSNVSIKKNYLNYTVVYSATDPNTEATISFSAPIVGDDFRVKNVFKTASSKNDLASNVEKLYVEMIQYGNNYYEVKAEEGQDIYLEMTADSVFISVCDLKMKKIYSGYSPVENITMTTKIKAKRLL